MQRPAALLAAVSDRPRRAVLVAGLALALPGLLAGCLAVARPAPETWAVDGLRRTAPLAPGMAVAVENGYGDLRLRPSDSGEVEASAQAQRWADEPPAELRIERHGRELSVTVVQPRRHGGRDASGPRRRVDLALLVPPGFPVRARSRDGVLEAKGLAGPLDLATTGGDLTVALPAGAGAEARLRTRGGISASGRIEAGRPGRERRATVTVGGGGPALSLASRTGDITLTAPAAPLALTAPRTEPRAARP